MRRALTIPLLLLLLLTLVSFSVVPSGTLLKEAKAIAGPPRLSTIITNTSPPPLFPIRAFDGNGRVVGNGGITPSHSIRFLFIPTSSTTTYTYTCRLDGLPPFSCFGDGPNQIAFGGLSQGPHQFSVQTKDTTGFQAPTVVFSWTIGTTAPPNTTITSAVDGNNAPVQNSGTTSSNSIKFSFATTEFFPPYTYQCILDGASSSCTSPAAFANLSPGAHHVSVQTTDVIGNQATTPVFSWTIITNTSPPPLQSNPSHTATNTTKTKYATIPTNINSLTHISK